LAEAVFQEARELSAQGKIELACPKFAESQRIDPATGTLLNLAACHESIGKLATAWSEFNQALSAAGRDGREDRVRFAKEHIRDLETKLSHLTILVRTEHALAELEIRLDDVPVGRAAWGTALPVDPGRHVVSAHAPGAPWRKEIAIVAQAQDLTVEVPSLGQGRAATLVDAADSSATPADSGRAMLLVSAGAGAVGIVAGSVFGLYALNRWHDAEHACPTGRGCNRTAIDARSSANNFAIASDIAFGVGVLGVGAAAYLWMVAPRASTSGTHVQAVPVLRPGTTGMAVEGHF
jgi:hypothetical protein